MTRRAAAHDYSRSGIYHITLHVAEGMGCPLGKVVGDAKVPDGHPDAPRVDLSPIGKMVEHELLTAIHTHYPMAEVQDYVVMPEHIHFLLRVKGTIVSPNGKRLPLGQLIAGFKKGCNKRFWELTGDNGRQTAAHTAAPSVAGGLPASALSRPAGPYKVPSDGTSGRQPLFQEGFCDVMPVDEAQLATQRAYIKGNPRSRLLRTSQRDRLMPQRGSVVTALTLCALQGYLRRECGATQAAAEVMEAIGERLLVLQGEAAATQGTATVVCDSYGERSLLERRLLPVVCHRKDRQRFAEQKARCLSEAQNGAVLVSARIAKGEQEIMDEAVRDGFSVVIIHDNGFPDRYHSSAERIDLCAAGRLLLVSPWRYQYRGKQEAISVPECKAMNCVAQALCRQKDGWWEQQDNETSIHQVNKTTRIEN